jgi:4a-hydroxytetrahydrobiopterin dehydratase
MQRLNEEELKKALPELPGWNLEHGELVHNLTLADFQTAIATVNRIAFLAEDANHHPDIDIRYNKLRLALVTHDAGGITENDISLARAISALF